MRVYRLFLHPDGALFALITAKRQGRDYLKEGVGLYRSRDGGENWECITKSLGLLWPKDFSVSPKSSKVIFLGAADAGGTSRAASIAPPTAARPGSASPATGLRSTSAPTSTRSGPAGSTPPSPRAPPAPPSG